MNTQNAAGGSLGGRSKSVLAAARRPSVMVAGASIVGRIGVLAAFLAVSNEFSGATRDAILFILGATIAVQVVLDPTSVGAFVVTEWASDEPALNRGLMSSGLRFYALCAIAILATPLVIAALRIDVPHAMLIASSVGVLAAVEAMARFGRSRFQANQQFGGFAIVDLLVGAGRAAVALAVICAPRVEAFAAANFLVAAVLLAVVSVWILPGSSLGRSADWPVRRFARGVWAFLAGTTASAIYSQGPLLILGTVGTVHAGAIYAVATRVTQPIELVPAAMAAVFLTTLSGAQADSRGGLERTQLRTAALAGVAAAALVAAFSQIAPSVFGLGGEQLTETLLVLSLALPLKFINYQLVMIALATGRAKSRAVAASVVAAVSIVLVLIFAGAGPTAVAGVAVVTEALLLVTLTIASRVIRQVRMG